MPPITATLRRFERVGWELWLVPAVIAAGWAAVLRASGPDLALARGLVFVGGPLLLLGGLHARLGGYLHAGPRQRLLPRPIDPRAHFSAAVGQHRRGLLLSGLLGVFAIVLGTIGAVLSARVLLGLLADFAWQWALAAALEPLIPGTAAWLGRRFESERPEHQFQRTMGGGWTIPEAVIHLYAPAMGVGLATALAMPGQLWLDRTIDGLASPPALAVVGALALPVAAALGFVVAPRLYQRGMFGSVPWVHEAMQTLAGPPVPEAVPAWLLAGHDPVRRLVLQQFWRTTPVPGLRLIVLLGGAAWMAFAAPPSVPVAAIGLGLAAAWLVPGMRVRALAANRARLCSTLPLPPASRAGRSWSAWALVWSPVVVASLVIAVSWSTHI